MKFKVGLDNELFDSEPHRGDTGRRVVWIIRASTLYERWSHMLLQFICQVVPIFNFSFDSQGTLIWKFSIDD